MSRTGRPRAGGTRLFAAYAAASLVPVVVLGAVLAAGIRQDAVDRALEYGRAQAAVVEEMAIGPALRGQDLGTGLTEAERERLSAATDLAVFRGSILRLRLRDFSGAVLFADDGAVGPVEALPDYPAGEDVVPSTGPGFALAAGGGTDVALLDRDGLAVGRVIRVLQPIVADTSGRSIGVLELLLPYDTVAAEVEAATTRTYWRLGAGLGVLYLVIGAISWSTTRRLRRQAAQAEHDALHDPLTGLANRELFARRVDAELQRGTPGAVVLVDLDRFKEVNDTLGHHAGDQLLREVGVRLAATVRAGDTVARLGGDEFGLLLPGLDDPAGARELVERVSEALAAEAVVDGVPLAVEASCGIAMHPADAADVETLMTCADAAMYQGKRGASGIVVFDRRSTAPSAHSPALQLEARRALEDGDLRLHYQPQVDLATGRTVGVEALLRWQHPRRGLLGPGEFLPALEQSGVMGALTEWVLRQALADCAAWVAAGEDWTVSVNVSVRNLEAPGFAATVARLAAEAGVPPWRLHLEVTETALPADLAAASACLAELAAHGFGAALDDFGVGFASLSHLRSLALTEVKVDRAFVTGVDAHAEDAAVVRSLVELAHGLGLSVCAEGVETPEVADWLRSVGCDRAQGWHFSRPLPWPELTRAAGLVPALPVEVLP
ncbi:diguanylate cyclase (GGDEF) domain-containing protein [Geodermatophilus telluris]|uniref:Diguanylate cyclase (GGDEF) domain-containing protein n=1 Tax=Geodermatophilus telluris TaxID=1190417 RepID=A0A1G6L3C7_9ACTN|nr:GGDEF and EAL domain-containing protein [Geodermatophilus telluris]SDC37166.1 diguanylate cyclase (GGDEF) domain-containing protein [Geodermatophilus telluris]